MAIRSEKEYVAIGGVRCPVCLSSDIQGDSINYECGELVQRIGCNACQASWDDIYKLDGYEFHDYDGVGRPQALLQDVLNREN